MRGIEIYIYEDDGILGFNEDGNTTFELKLEVVKDNEELKNVILAYVKSKFDNFFNELKTVLGKSKEEEVSDS